MSVKNDVFATVVIVSVDGVDGALVETALGFKEVPVDTKSTINVEVESTRAQKIENFQQKKPLYLVVFVVLR